MHRPRSDSITVTTSMLRKPLLFILTPIIVILAAVVIAALLISAPAKFVVSNLDSEPVTVTAVWRDKTKRLGPLPPNTSAEFFVDDEAAMQFEIVRANGTSVTAGNVYFTSNTMTRVEISHTAVDIKSAVE